MMFLWIKIGHNWRASPDLCVVQGPTPKKNTEQNLENVD